MESKMISWERVRRIESSDANVLKYVFERGDAVAEAVLYKYPTYQQRTVVCCSTQSGCPVGCRFCGAGDSFVRSLSAQEIYEQPMHLFADRGVDPRAVDRLQIMFMSMGEPLLNLDGLTGALRGLYGAVPNAALLISTSAPRVDYEPLRRISREIPTIGLQFSVHESTDEARNRLIPFKAKLSLNEIAFEGECWHFATGRRPFFNYCAHEGNVSDEDADRLADLFDPLIWEATVSVVCERDESVAAANARQRELATGFQARLLERGYSTRMFDPAGQDDIGGGCGQLWFVQDWMRQHPDHARPSAGRRLPVVHAPR
jgi:23S rRNA (adenine2503-C2)-methyltransferase